MSTQVVLVKLAAIGDVTLACRALKDLAARYEIQATLHWIIDKDLKDLAQSLLERASPLSGIKIVWHPVDATKLFQGSKIEKAKEAMRLFSVVAKAQPSQLIILHRDWRYKTLLRPAFAGRLNILSRKSLHELEAYREALKKSFRLNSEAKIQDSKSLPERASTKTIGILVGGAQNQKVLYLEKRWPRFHELIPLLLSRTDCKIRLYGAPSDAALVDELLNKVPVTDRIENYVGELPLKALPSSLSELDAFISVDSGLAHIAASVMTEPHQKVISLFGPSDPKLWKPVASGKATAKLLYKAKACSPCYSNDGEFRPCQFEGIYFQHCMTDITPEDVLDALLS